MTPKRVWANLDEYWKVRLDHHAARNDVLPLAA
jgi:hypothetical protein